MDNNIDIEFEKNELNNYSSDDEEIVEVETKKRKLDDILIKCTMCKKSVINLNQHMKRVHLVPRKKCDKCSYECVNESTMTKHVVTHELDDVKFSTRYDDAVVEKTEEYQRAFVAYKEGSAEHKRAMDVINKKYIEDKKSLKRMHDDTVTSMIKSRPSHDDFVKIGTELTQLKALQAGERNLQKIKIKTVIPEPVPESIT
jgi:hypothetical protein